MQLLALTALDSRYTSACLCGRIIWKCLEAASCCSAAWRSAINCGHCHSSRFKMPLKCVSLSNSESDNVLLNENESLNQLLQLFQLIELKGVKQIPLLLAKPNGNLNVLYYAHFILYQRTNINTITGEGSRWRCVECRAELGSSLLCSTAYP